MKTLVLFFLVIFQSFWDANAKAGDLNLHRIDGADNGFALYRLGRPGKNDIRQLCLTGITEIMVLSGSADEVEMKYAPSECPALKVVYNEKQNVKVALSAEFLAQFDQWIEEAKLSGKKIAFRCECGCHRTGRLAAYYQMKEMNLSAEQAIDDMMDKGKYMGMFKELVPQVYDLRDFIDGRACQQEQSENCVRRSRQRGNWR